MTEPVQSVTITRTREDYLAFSQHVTKGFQNLRVYYIITLAVLILLVITAIEVLNRKQYLPGSLIISLAMYISGVVVIMLLLRQVFTRSAKREYLNEGQSFLRKKQITIDEKGFRESSDISEGYVMWQGVDRIERTKDLMLVYVDKMSAFCIPIRNFESPQHANQFYETMLGFWHKAHGRSVPLNT